jgi:hypothetical protein
MAQTRMPNWASSRAAGSVKADDAALGGRIGRLPDLAVVSRDRGGVDRDSALAGVERIGLAQVGGEQAQGVERADQVDLDHPLVVGERLRAVAADDALGDADAGAVDQDAGTSVLRVRLLDGGSRRCRSRRRRI